MKFKSKFGIGEIVIRNVRNKNELISDEMLKVIGIVFFKENPAILCEYPKTGNRVYYTEDELEGDPDFDQIYGYEEEGYEEKPIPYKEVEAYNLNDDIPF